MNKIYAWGKSISPSFSVDNSKETPYIETDQQINQISCGSDHCFFKSSDQLYAFGSNQHGQLGININPHSQIQICRIFVPSKRKIVSLSCGWDHTLVLDQAGDLFSCGKGEEGALGLGSDQNSYGFKLVLNGVKKMSAGKDHSLAICGPKVYGWGNSTEGQLGFQSKRKCYSPKQLNVYTSHEVYAGIKYSIFATIKGVFGTGLNNLNQLGLGHTKTIHYPKRLNIQEAIVGIDGGNYCIAQTESKQYYLWGSGGFGNYKFPTKFPFLKQCDKICLGLNFGVALKNDRIYVWGSNRFGQLGILQNVGKQYPVECMELTKMMLNNFSCGNNFVVGFSSVNESNHWQNLMNRPLLNNKNCQKSSSNVSQKYKSHQSFYRSGNSQNKLIKNTQATKTKVVTQNSEDKKMQSFQLKINSANKEQDQSTQQKFKTNTKNKQKNSYQNQDTNENIKELTDQLQNVKLQIQETNLRNQQLLHQNQELKEVLTQCLQQLESQKQKYHDRQELQIQNVRLQTVLNKKKEYISQVRQEYLTLSNMVQNNQFLRNVLSLSQPNYRDRQIQLYEKGEQMQEDQTDAFSKQLNSLKKILQLANER